MNPLDLKNSSNFPEMALWRAVIATAMADIYIGRAIEAEPAKEFLLKPSRWFDMVCDMALLDPDAVRDRARTVMNARMNKISLRYIDLKPKKLFNVVKKTCYDECRPTA